MRSQLMHITVLDKHRQEKLPAAKAMEMSLFTFNCDLFNLLGFLINPFLPADLIRGTHQLL